MEIGSKFTADVKDLSPDGAGVVEHPSGMIFFVPGVWPGEAGEFIVTERSKNFGKAKLDTLQLAHRDRREAACKHHGFGPTDCSNCAWQFITYDAQLEAKQNRIHKRLEAYISGDHIAPIWGAPEEFGYRNRTQFKTDGKSIGYVNNSSGQLAPIDDCPVLNKKNRNSLRQLQGRLPEIKWAPDTGWTSLDIDDAISAEKVSINQRRPFRQGNSAQNRKLRDWLTACMTQLKISGPVIELFSGSGNLTEVIAAQKCRPILAVEAVGAAVNELREKKLPQTRALICDLFDAAALRGFVKQNPIPARLLVLDPPREGFKLLDVFLRAYPTLEAVIYVSCDLDSFHRDLSALQQAGFELQAVQPMDLFPQTPHIEILSILRRVK
jgi:23S rRNA (uracil1939-C5)-methyltransferase